MAAKGAVKAQASDMAKKVGGEKLKEATADPARSHHFVGKNTHRRMQENTERSMAKHSTRERGLYVAFTSRHKTSIIP